VLLTGQASIQGAIAVVNDGNVFRFLTKPCAPPDLTRAIEDAIEQARLITADRELLERKVDAMFGHLKRAERLATVGTLCGAIGHELGSILSAFKCSLAAVRERRLAGAPPLDEDVETLERVEAQLEAHARSLLGFGRPRNRTPACDIGRAVCDALELLRAGGMLRRTRCELHLPPSTVTVAADQSEIGQVVMNLIKNASEATEEAARRDHRSPQVCVTLEAGDRDTTLSIRDNGSGINSDDLPFVFEPYFTTKPEDQGTGLGLYIVKQIVERAGGRVTVESEPGVGTTFYVTLPMFGTELAS
jgi:signal transduction histidine kinase